jgi:hypothetical protein
MFKHVIMWRIMEQDQEGNSKPQMARKIKALLEDLKGKIDVIRHLEVGLDVVGTPSSFDVVVYSEFDSRQDYQTYLDHPDHKKAGAYIVSVLKERAVVDYEG